MEVNSWLSADVSSVASCILRSVTIVNILEAFVILRIIVVGVHAVIVRPRSS